MAKKDRFLVVDIGSVALHVAEFELTPDDNLMMHAFDTLEYSEPLSDSNRSEMISATLSRILASGKFQSKNACLCISGQYAFMRFNKVPFVSDDEDDIRNMVQNQAKQDIPFPIDEVVWDYQLISGYEEDELEVMFAVIKNEIIGDILHAIKSVGLRVRLIDFSPASLFNVARANYVGEEECSMLLDIGGKCTILVFLEGNRFFARSIPIAGSAISQQIAREFNISVEEAEVLKRRYGFVALGGAYEEPESEVAATISKIIRNVMTRLHGEINRTINYYRSQKKGSKPAKLYLAGGSSTMMYTQHFFSEKLRMEVNYFNAFNIVRLGPGVDRPQLEQQAHLYPEAVGTALRYVRHCPVEIDLATADMRSEGTLRQKIPVIALSCVLFLAGLGMWWGLNEFQINKLKKTIAEQRELIANSDAQLAEIEFYKRSRDKAEENFTFLRDFMKSRTQWPHFLNALQMAKPLDVWITKLEVTTPPSKEEEKRVEETVQPEAILPWMTGPAGGTGSNKNNKVQASADKIEWIRIEGYEVKIPEEKKVDGKSQYVRKIFTEEQVFAFKEVIKKYIAEHPEYKKFEDQVVGKKNVVTPNVDLILSSIFENALRTLPEFDPIQTKITGVTQTPFSQYRNISRFEMRIHLAQPINLKR